MQQLYLSRRNLLVLLSKLNRAKQGEVTACTIIKCDTVHPVYPASALTMVTAVEDADYYYERPAGEMHPADDSPLDTSREPVYATGADTREGIA